MAGLGAVLLTILKIFGWTLSAILLLLLIVVLVPFRVVPRYENSVFSMELRILLWRFTLWTNDPQKAKKKKRKKAEKKQVPQKQEPDQAKKSAPWEGLPLGIGERIDAALALAASDPAALAECAFGHLSLFGRGLVRCIPIRRLNIYWTITADEASDTAIRYGAAMAALNNTMSILYRHGNVKAERLWLEPDYTGEHKGERRVSCVIRSDLALLLWLLLRTLLRLYNEPLFRPQEPEKAKTTRET